MDKLKLLQEVQLNLFHPQPSLPRWDQIPTEVQKATCKLLAQMLIEYFTGRARTSQQKELIDE